jgi:hypothetical protein
VSKNQCRENNMFRRIIQSGIVAGVVAIALCSLAQEALAQCEGGIICTGKITHLYTQSTGALVSPVRGAVFIKMDTPFTSLSCTPAGDPSTYIVLLPNQKLFKETYESLLTGIANDLTMKVRIDPDSPVCMVAYVTIERE